MKTSAMKLRVFGVLRELADPEGFLELKGEAGTPRELKSLLRSHLEREHPEFDATVVDDCAIADLERILGDEVPIHPGLTLAVLPPVCGG